MEAPRCSEMTLHLFSVNVVKSERACILSLTLHVSGAYQRPAENSLTHDRVVGYRTYLE